MNKQLTAKAPQYIFFFRLKKKKRKTKQTKKEQNKTKKKKANILVDLIGVEKIEMIRLFMWICSVCVQTSL